MLVQCFSRSPGRRGENVKFTPAAMKLLHAIRLAGERGASWEKLHQPRGWTLGDRKID